MPIDYKRYPPNWKTEIVPRIKEREKHKCKKCGVKNYDVGYRHGEKHTFASIQEHCPEIVEKYLGKRKIETYKEARILQSLLTDKKRIVIVLTIAHLDHDEENLNVKDERLAALCQWCHLNYDVEEKKRRRTVKKYTKTLFPM